MSSSYAKDVDEASKGTHKPEQRDLIGDTLIFTLATLCILLFILNSVGYFLIAKPLEARLTSAALRNLRYEDVSSPYFKATIAMEIRIENPNWGFFEFPTSKGDVLYKGRVVGEMKISGQRVAEYTAIRTEIMTEVSYVEDQASSGLLKKNGGLIMLEIRGKIKGEVHLEALSKTSVGFKCFLYLNLSKEVIQLLSCP